MNVAVADATPRNRRGRFHRTGLVDGIVGRGGQASAGGSAGPLTLGWVATSR